MQLTENTKRELKNLLRRYQNDDKIVDEKFINNAMEIINEDKQIEGKLKYEVGRKFILARSKYENGKNYFDINGVRLFVAKFPELYREFFDESYDAMIANIYALYFVLHDVYNMTHRLSLTGVEELDRAYYDFYQVIDKLSKRKYAKYLRSARNLIVDRTAKIEAFRELIDINAFSNLSLIPEVQYMDSLLKGYEKGDKSPMHRDFDYLGLDFSSYDFSDLSFIESLEQGITEDGDNITKTSILRGDYLGSKKSYGEVYKELKKVEECQR